jgi:small subunit ribosomal protein S9
MAKAKEDPWIVATGRRKTSVARVRMKAGSGKITVNRQEMGTYFPVLKDRQRVVAPLKAASAESAWDIQATVQGGGTTGQSGAVTMGIARALVKSNPELDRPMRDSRFLTRDSRKKERKKYGRRGARRGFQFSKR